MAVKILIKRKVPADKSAELTRLLKNLRVLTLSRDGYISGETLMRIDSPGESLVISTWESADHWRKWVLDDKRRELQERIDTLLGHKTVYEIYAYL